MPPNGASRDSTRFVSLFQKAHGFIAVLQRVDDQIATLFEQRRRAIEDLRAVQSQINGEFQRVLELDRVVPADMLSHGAEEEVLEEAPATIEIKPTLEAKPQMTASRTAAASGAPSRMGMLQATGS